MRSADARLGGALICDSTRTTDRRTSDGRDADSLAHLSDLHFRRSRNSHARLDKRILGTFWRYRRRREHRADVLDALRADLPASASTTSP
jgi:hypothetical protein